MNLLVEWSVRIGRSLGRGGAILLLRFDQSLTKRRGRSFRRSKVFCQQELFSGWVANKYGAAVIGFGVLDVVSQIGSPRGSLGCHAAPYAVNVIVRRNRIAIRPARVVPKMENKFRGIVVDVPTLRHCGNRK